MCKREGRVMAYWDAEKGTITHAPSKPHPHYSGWEIVDCGCCAGIEWGGYYPRECRTCGGGGYICQHLKSGALAWYPGGPFVGSTARRIE